jgi:hypothetical protein
MLPTDNTALALKFGGADHGDWLARCDAGMQATFDSLIAHGRFTGAFECLLAHLTKTETIRTRVHGPGPTWAQAVDAFDCAVDRQQPAQLATIAALVDAAHQPPAVEPAVLRAVPGEVCGHQRGPWRCIRPNHPSNPGGHVYHSLTGSDIPDRHDATEAVQS